MSARFVFVICLLMGAAILGYIGAGILDCCTDKKVWDAFEMGADPDPYLDEYASLTSSREPTLEDYWKHALVTGEVYLARLDQAGPAAIELQGKFSNVEEIIDFFNERNYGVCRHRAVLGYWLLRELYPEADIWLVVGLYVGPGTVWVNMQQLDMNHVWLEVNGKVVDLTGEKDGEYHPYVRVKIEGGVSEVVPVITEIEQEFQRDQSLS